MQRISMFIALSLILLGFLGSPCVAQSDLSTDATPTSVDETRARAAYREALELLVTDDIEQDDIEQDDEDRIWERRFLAVAENGALDCLTRVGLVKEVYEDGGWESPAFCIFAWALVNDCIEHPDSSLYEPRVEVEKLDPRFSEGSEREIRSPDVWIVNIKDREMGRTAWLRDRISWHVEIHCDMTKDHDVVTKTLDVDWVQGLAQRYGFDDLGEKVRRWRAYRQRVDREREAARAALEQDS